MHPSVGNKESTDANMFNKTQAYLNGSFGSVSPFRGQEVSYKMNGRNKMSYDQLALGGSKQFNRDQLNQTTV